MPKNAMFRHSKETKSRPRHEHERIAPGRAGEFRQGQGLDRPLRLVERGRARGASPDGKVEQQEAEKLALLRKAWKEGVDSGDADEIDFTALKTEARARLAASKRDA